MEPCGAFGTAEKLREDVWLVFQREIERRRLGAVRGKKLLNRDPAGSYGSLMAGIPLPNLMSISSQPFREARTLMACAAGWWKL